MKKLKHNHTLTDFLKFGIFAILLLMPILIFVPNAFYYGFNEHAVAQEKTEQVPIYYESNEVNSIDDLIIGNIYHWNNNYSSQGSISNDSRIFNCEYLSIVPNNATNIRITMSANGALQYGYDINNNSYYNAFNLVECDLVISSIVNPSLINSVLLSKITYTSSKVFTGLYDTITTNMSITDSMSYAWDSVWQNDLFSWTSNTGIYTVINNMNTTLGVPDVARLADYLTYITLFTVIYVIIDIIIETFTMLTHLFNKEPK